MNWEMEAHKRESRIFRTAVVVDILGILEQSYGNLGKSVYRFDTLNQHWNVMDASPPPKMRPQSFNFFLTLPYNEKVCGLRL
jgi:hypothetical protein